MKKVLFGFIIVLVVFIGIDVSAAPPAKVQVTATKKKGDIERGKPVAEGEIAKVTDSVAYVFTLKNLTFNDLGKVKVDYILFVERPEIGDKKNQPVRIERIKGSREVEAVPRQTPQSVTTDDISLVTKNLTGGYHYLNGGLIKAEDSIAGIWVKVFLDGQQVGEYASPPTVTKQIWEK